MEKKWLEKIYAGVLGMDAGMRLGAPVENPWWTYERLRDYYGEIRGYLRRYKTTHTADDDVNGPAIFLRALTDNGGLDFTAEMAGETWLNYAREGRGMFWWGGEDVSTEHRAYANLKRGVKAPESGSIARNGKVAAEQIGGQIFVDTWGLVCPGDPRRAAVFARRMASASHDGEALNGAAFMASAVSAAFTCATVDETIDAALRQIPPESLYRQVVDAVRSFHAAHPEDFRSCRDFVDREWGNDRFPGGYHIIPNAGICVLALLYGGGDLGRTIETACMCGFDTDCNGSSVGTITGVLGGLEGVPERYRRPIDDTIVLSSVSGYLNILDVPTFAREIFQAGCRLRGEEGPAVRRGTLDFDFGLPGSTHGMTLSDRASYELRHRDGLGRDGGGCLELQADGKGPDPVDLSFKAYFIRAEMDGERYEPVFAPRAYPGQTVTCVMKSCQTAPAEVRVTPFVTRCMAGDRIDLAGRVLPEGEWTELAFQIPDLEGDQAHDVGWQLALKPAQPPWIWGKVWIDRVTVDGSMDYTIDTSIQRMEFGEPTPFSTDGGRASLEDGALYLEGRAFTGNYYLRDGEVSARLTGKSGCLLLRAQGCRRYYALGFSRPGYVSIARWEAGTRTELCGAPWPAVPSCRLRAAAEGDRLTLWVDGVRALEARDGRFAYGMAGACQEENAPGRWRDFRICGSV